MPYFQNHLRKLFQIISIILVLLFSPLAPIRAADNPIKLSYFWNPPDTQIAIDTVGKAMQLLILSRPDGNQVEAIKKTGFSGKMLQYLRVDTLEGPYYLANANAPKCSEAQKNYTPYPTQAASGAGHFCQIHNSIVNKTAFDHDLNPSTPDVIASEDWFLHDGNGNRIGLITYHGNQGLGFFYAVNPGSNELRQYIASHLVRELVGDSARTKSGMDGIFMDNVSLSPACSYREQKEYSSSDEFYKNELLLLRTIAEKASGRGLSLWANIRCRENRSINWDDFSPYLDGIMRENFTGWGSNYGYFNAAMMEEELKNIERWINKGKQFLAVNQGNNDEREARFGLATLLLVTDGTRTFYRHTKRLAYNEFWFYPTYEFKLGVPLAGRYKVEGTNDSIYRRQFECGTVEVNFSQRTAVISPSSCTIITATPTPTISSAPTATPKPTLTSTPTPTPKPNVAPVIQTWNLKAGQIGAKYEQQIVVYDENPNDKLTVTITTSELPTNVTFDKQTEYVSGGIRYVVYQLNGKPRNSGTFHPTVTVKDQIGASATRRFTLKIST